MDIFPSSSHPSPPSSIHTYTFPSSLHFSPPSLIPPSLPPSSLNMAGKMDNYPVRASVLGARPKEATDTPGRVIPRHTTAPLPCYIFWRVWRGEQGDLDLGVFFVLLLYTDDYLFFLSFFFGLSVMYEIGVWCEMLTGTVVPGWRCGWDGEKLTFIYLRIAWYDPHYLHHLKL